MALSAKGVSRQDAHEEIRILSHQASDVVKKEGKDNDLIDRIRKSAFFSPVIDQLDQLLNARTFIGRAPEQVEKFTGVNGEVALALRKYEEILKAKVTVDLKV